TTPPPSSSTLFPTRRSSDLKLIKFPVGWKQKWQEFSRHLLGYKKEGKNAFDDAPDVISGMVEDFQTDRLFTESNTLYFNPNIFRSEEHTSELQSRENLVCRL